MPKKKNHEPIHLKIDPKLDGELNKRWGFALRTTDGGRWWTCSNDPQYDSVCGVGRPKHMVSREQLELVTCNRCKKYIAVYVK